MSFHPKNLFPKDVDNYLIKQHKNSIAELLHPEVPEQSGSMVK
jgi:hypothetical protein